MNRSKRAFLSAFLLLIPIAALAANSDQQFRDCMRDAMNNRENRIIDVSRNYYNDRIAAFEDRRNRLSDSWGIENDHDRSREQTAIDRDVSNRLHDLDNNYRIDLNTIRRDFRNDRQRCEQDLRDRRRSVPIGRKCVSSDECSPPTGICTTELGECRSSCSSFFRPEDNCVQVCTGRCQLR